MLHHIVSWEFFTIFKFDFLFSQPIQHYIYLERVEFYMILS